MEPFVLNLEAVHKAAAAATASAPWQPMQPPPTTCASYTTTKRPPDVPRESAGRPLPTIATCPPLMEAEQQLIALGSELTPLRTPDEALTFLRAMGRFPPGTPARAEQIVRECRHPLLLDASHAQQLIDKLSKWRSWEELAADLHRLHPLVSRSTIVLVPDVQKCVACGGERLASARHYTQSGHPTVMTDSGVLTADLGCRYISRYTP